MSVFLIRPPVAELVFQLYGRPLHPELFDILAVRKYPREDYEVRVWITRTVHVHDEILADGEKRGVLHNFQPNHRLAISPLGHVVVESRPGCVFISTFHTFPEENTVVKSQTLIEVAG